MSCESSGTDVTGRRCAVSTGNFIGFGLDLGVSIGTALVDADGMGQHHSGW